MHKYKGTRKTTIKINTSYKGERIEEKINRIVNNKEPITDGAPIIFTERKKGVEPQYDIRTDRFEIAVDATDKIAKSHLARREENIKNFEKKLDSMNKKPESGADGDKKPGGSGENQGT